jgi:hypothetical protein
MCNNRGTKQDNILFNQGDIQMNTCLNNVYLKVAKIDSRTVRMVLMVVAVLASGGVILGLPISGDVGI